MQPPRLDHNDEVIDFDEASEISHINHLKEFEDKIWPIYVGHHMTKGEVFISFNMVAMMNVLRKIRDTLEEREAL